MRIAKSLAFMLTLLAVNAFAADPFAVNLDGHWKVVYSGTDGAPPKTVGSIVLDLKNTGPGVTGVVKIGPWPGEAPVTEAKLEGDHLIFPATGSLSSTTGIPTCRIDATIRGDEMTVLLTVVKNAGGPLSASRVYEFRGARTSP